VLFYDDCIKLAYFEADPASVAFILDDKVRYFDNTDDGIFRAFLLADVAAITGIHINIKSSHIAANRS
jgi:hypothetical protein